MLQYLTIFRHSICEDIIQPSSNDMKISFNQKSSFLFIVAFYATVTPQVKAQTRSLRGSASESGVEIDCLTVIEPVVCAREDENGQVSYFRFNNMCEAENNGFLSVECLYDNKISAWKSDQEQSSKTLLLGLDESNEGPVMCVIEAESEPLLFPSLKAAVQKGISAGACSAVSGEIYSLIGQGGNPMYGSVGAIGQAGNQMGVLCENGEDKPDYFEDMKSALKEGYTALQCMSAADNNLE